MPSPLGDIAILKGLTPRMRYSFSPSLYWPSFIDGLFLPMRTFVPRLVPPHLFLGPISISSALSLICASFCCDHALRSWSSVPTRAFLLFTNLFIVIHPSPRPSSSGLRRWLLSTFHFFPPPLLHSAYFSFSLHAQSFFLALSNFAKPRVLGPISTLC